jgi:hypothetical protein
MNRRLLPRALLLCWSLLAALPGFGAHLSNHPTYDGVVNFGSQHLYIDDGCLSIHGTVTSGNFFDDLRRIDVGGELLYKKRGEVVKEYPESLTTSIHLIARCPAQLPRSPTSIFHGHSYGLKFEVNWKHEMQMRPAGLSPVVARCMGYSSVVISAEALVRDVAVPSVDCQMTVDSKGVPLGDHLIVSIFTADGRPLTRISAAP